VASRFEWTGRFAVVVAAMLAAAPGVFAQGCAMCYTEAASQGPRARRSLDYAILVLLIPAVTMFAGVFVALRRRESDFANADVSGADGSTPPKRNVAAARANLSANRPSPSL